jgi:hypothetical protein
MMDLIFKVITSWQVIVVTVVLVIYCFLVNATARLNSKNKTKFPSVPKKNKRVLPPPESPLEEGTGDTMDELGLEE